MIPGAKPLLPIVIIFLPAGRNGGELDLLPSTRFESLVAIFDTLCHYSIVQPFIFVLLLSLSVGDEFHT
jgi:hypothetical protein